jgi:DNA-binding beta-propeller fold protein YncE
MRGLVPILVLLAASGAAAQEGAGAGEVDLRARAAFGQHLYEGPLSEPMGLAVDDGHKEVLVADTGGDRIGIFTLEGAPLFSFGGSDAVRAPRKVAVDPKGHILVLDRDRASIKVFNYRGELLGPMRLPGLGAAPEIEAFAVDPGGKIYVGEGRSNQVWVFGPDGALEMRIGAHGASQGTFSSIAGIAIDAESIVVTDHVATPVQVFDRRGHLLAGFGKHDMGRENFSLPEGVALDAKGRIVVVDSLRHEIKLFDKTGRFIARFGGLGSEPGQVAFPSDVAVDRTGKVYVLEKLGARVQVFEETDGATR